MDMPDLVSTHCIAHRLYLAVLNSIKDARDSLQKFIVLKKLYSFYQYSPKRLKELEKVTAILKNKLLTFKYLHSVWWVANRVGALTALVNNYPAVLLNLEEIGSGKGDEAVSEKRPVKENEDIHICNKNPFSFRFFNNI
jgi:hypothetical protein